MKSLCAFVFLLLATVAEASEVKVIVHGSNPVETITREKLSDLFLKKTTRWETGRAVTPVDQPDSASIREEFSRKFLSKEVAWVKSYWQKMIFSGRATPPAELSSDAEILAFIRSNPDSIGYVSAGAPQTAGIKILHVKE
jgi:ABC-type phosphate transport system substrate-binding protein